MKNNLIIWVFGALSLLSYLIAQGSAANPETGYPFFGLWNVLWIIFQLVMTYGVWLLLQEKKRPKFLIILPLFFGILGAVIIYLIPARKDVVSSSR